MAKQQQPGVIFLGETNFRSREEIWVLPIVLKCKEMQEIIKFLKKERKKPNPKDPFISGVIPGSYDYAHVAFVPAIQKWIANAFFCDSLDFPV